MTNQKPLNELIKINEDYGTTVKNKDNKDEVQKHLMDSFLQSILKFYEFCWA